MRITSLHQGSANRLIPFGAAPWAHFTQRGQSLSISRGKGGPRPKGGAQTRSIEEKPSYSQTAGGLFPFRCISGIDMLYWRWWRLKCGSPREVTLPEGLQRDTRISRATGFPAPLYQYTSFAALSQEGDASRWRGYRNVHWTYPFWAAGCLRQWKRGHCKALI